MIRILATMCLLFTVAIALTGCLDPEPSEISVIATMDGQPADCWVQLFSGKGKQLQEQATERGQVYLKQLTPGLYIVKFCNRDHQLYPAVRKVNVNPGASEIVKVDLNDASTNPAE